ncbi:hypothetical protein PTTG_12297 [Puccinia triticina 1-1 BBBD Race 1]|uniref:Type 2A phosphatase activator TIP41 n=2 Tax=Puccinia triticina TaxID=208348 RepID=A0A180GRP1_PUCT1|nr:uncharacterized protein PtA15_6A532 [Puccinia triticina]OAV95365.1 hypothetical protein PTTG_12297 [Puccinia triticina 1-1 BBBD Race 1]WAQ85903.1 hypothetical protein PtA15_6A532 [Puccinia triticina]WAR55797.1 hypothetical protein PtB15_6B540 [Puccinia triticina]
MSSSIAPASGIPEHKVTSLPVGSEGSLAGDGKRNIEVEGWLVETCKLPILNSKEIKQFGEKLKVPLPEICFGNNYLSIKHPRSGFHYQWNTLDALLPLNPVEGEEQDYIKVAYADHWSQARKESDSVTKVVNPFDWTYTTTYSGTNHSSEIEFNSPPDPKDHGGIPLAVLSRPDPILFFDEVTLFEDELHDNGMASLQIKVRVMPTCIFALSRFFLRVDGVVFRLFDVRFYVDIQTNQIIREIKAKEMKYDLLKSRLPPENPHDLTPLTDPNFVSQALQMLKSEEFTIPSQAPSSKQDKPKKWRNMLGAHLDLASIAIPSSPLSIQ